MPVAALSAPPAAARLPARCALTPPARPPASLPSLSLQAELESSVHFLGHRVKSLEEKERYLNEVRGQPPGDGLSVAVSSNGSRACWLAPLDKRGGGQCGTVGRGSAA